ncbi:HET domain-containing protein [Verticillium alfalfae VaMs.102]|uniref:HET domain-containing protein n=1 Tax=Verticillium alfalfae (strain VaMs.102 / ATCC MYA-4576 / FGSC 10136) TaxID=526221 RepID=C9SWC9_VERA1|nr:HET domain-containing protein [Verticillium alfalfae VaMs.102]EEY23094.1 HET domain-containing protein [Verticillium alfalfae VaMs.102]
MRLINTTTLELKTAYGYATPLYAILSHTWSDEELLFEHLQAGITQRQKDTPSRGLSKILETCQRAKNDGLEYVWVDTCCIDKSSSAELSDAINSMFRWYEDSAACYIHLEDVSNRGRQGGVVDISHKRQHAPVDNIDVLSPVGRVGTMYHCGYCNNPKTLLPMMQQHSVAARMHWAARRRTTRQEDTTYCLLGLFGINMPLLYGEGTKAFVRLQGEIVRCYPADQSILAWLGYEVSAWAELPLEFALEDATSQRIVLTDCDPFDVLLRNPNGWETPPSSVAHIEILPAFPTFISSPQLIETPTGNITFGPSLTAEP